MFLLLQTAILVLSVYLVAKGGEIKLKGTKNPETDSLRNRLLALLLIVLGLGAGFGALYWMGGVAQVRRAFGF